MKVLLLVSLLLLPQLGAAQETKDATTITDEQRAQATELAKDAALMNERAMDARQKADAARTSLLKYLASIAPEGTVIDPVTLEVKEVAEPSEKSDARKALEQRMAERTADLEKRLGRK